MTCRHSNHSWLIAGGLIEWCYRCGAFRRLRITGDVTLSVDGAWAIPTGRDGKNPWDTYSKKDAAFRAKRKEGAGNG